MRVLVKKRRALPPPRLLSAGAASLSLLVAVVGVVVLFAKTPVCTYKRWGASSGDFWISCLLFRHTGPPSPYSSPHSSVP